jgi:hypothetical protein
MSNEQSVFLTGVLELLSCGGLSYRPEISIQVSAISDGWDFDYEDGFPDDLWLYSTYSERPFTAPK